MNGSGTLEKCGPVLIESFLDLRQRCPDNPLDLIANALLNGTSGTPENSALFASESWTDFLSSAIYISSAPLVSALGTDSQQKVAEAAQRNFSHLCGQSRRS